MTVDQDIRERGILFSGGMVRAILNGRKTQTRRVAKWKMWPGMPVESVEAHRIPFKDSPANECSWTVDHVENGGVYVEQDVYCPHGLVGDRLWVRETWRLGAHYAAYTAKDIRESAEFGTHPMDDHVHYRAQESPKENKWRSPIHMPRWASRILLEITGVRLQRVQKITQRDCAAEGLETTFQGHPISGLRHNYAALWDSLNAKRDYSWEANPWVWAITFKRLEADDA